LGAKRPNQTDKLQSLIKKWANQRATYEPYYFFFFTLLKGIGEEIWQPEIQPDFDMQV